MLNPKFIKQLYIRSQSADPSPPLGTILGNIGIMQLIFVHNLMKKLKIYHLILY